MFELYSCNQRLGVDTVGDVRPHVESINRTLSPEVYFRYIRRTQTPPDWLQMLTVEELTEIVDHGNCVSLVQQGIGGHPDRDADAGRAQGEKAVEEADKLGAPKGATIWCDCEWSARVLPPKSMQIAYCEAWALAVVSVGYRAGLYVGSSLGLTGEELYKLAGFTGYWKSASATQTCYPRGWQVVQTLMYRHNKGRLFPIVDGEKYWLKPGLVIDIDVLCFDSMWPNRGGRVRAIGK